MILYSLWSSIFNIRIIIIIIDNKKINSIFDMESKMIHFMGSNKYIITTKIKCWPVFKQDPIWQQTRGTWCYLTTSINGYSATTSRMLALPPLPSLALITSIAAHHHHHAKHHHHKFITSLSPNSSHHHTSLPSNKHTTKRAINIFNNTLLLSMISP